MYVSCLFLLYLSRHPKGHPQTNIKQPGPITHAPTSLSTRAVVPNNRSRSAHRPHSRPRTLAVPSDLLAIQIEHDQPVNITTRVSPWHQSQLENEVRTQESLRPSRKPRGSCHPCRNPANHTCTARTRGSRTRPTSGSMTPPPELSKNEVSMWKATQRRQGRTRGRISREGVDNVRLQPLEGRSGAHANQRKPLQPGSDLVTRTEAMHGTLYAQYRGLSNVRAFARPTRRPGGRRVSRTFPE